MSYPQNMIKLKAAAAIFTGVVFEPIEIGGKVAGYRAIVDGRRLEHTSLTQLCKELWERQRQCL